MSSEVTGLVSDGEATRRSQTQAIQCKSLNWKLNCDCGRVGRGGGVGGDS